MEFEKFAIGFDHRDRERLHALWDGILDDEISGRTGRSSRQFEEAWAAWNGLPAVATSSWTGAGARGARVLRAARQDRPLPLEHVHGHAARDPSRPARRSSSSTATATTSACRSTTSSGRSHEHKPAAVVPRPHRRPHRVRHRPDRRALPRRGDRPDRGLRARARRLLERPQAGHARRRRASGRSRRRRRSRPARAACSSRRHPELVEFARALPQLRQARLHAARASTTG